MAKKHLAAMLEDSCRRHHQKVAMRYKESGLWQEITYGDLGEKVRQVSSALIALGIQAGDMVGIFSQNRPEWTIADFGILGAGAVSVPIYATNTAAQAEYIASDADLKAIFVGDDDQLAKVQSFAAQYPELKTIVAFDPPAGSSGDNVMRFEALVALGTGGEHVEESTRRISQTAPESLATLIYTSGTTGEPKGVMLSHASFAHQIDAINANFDVGPEDRSLCFLPLSHVYERSWSFYVLSRGAQNNYMRNPREILDYLREVRPTAMVSVPRLYEKIHAAVMDRLEKSSPGKRRLFDWALGVGRRWADARQAGEKPGWGLRVNHHLADRLVLSKLREIVGGDKNFFSAGGAPLSKDIEAFFLAAGLLICQGYGLSETAPTVTYNTPQNFKFGTVGRPVPGCEVKIGAENEILVKGPNVMMGYYKKTEATAAVLKDGWFHTGDVGLIDDDGYLMITDRIKDLIITSGGKNIAPQRIETAVGRDHYIEQITTIGDRRKYVSALIVPSYDALENYAREKGIACPSREELLQHPEIIAFYRDRIDRQSTDLAGFETIKAFTLLPREFTQENGEITPTQKIKRKVVAKHYRAEIDAMYPDD
ncbi:MAG: long-chain fatty acid--CoA ligase [Desulfobacterales bacterium]|nr:long-chain fatty acid--CoA ligase [Desulfobacterales bacterium]